METGHEPEASLRAGLAAMALAGELASPLLAYLDLLARWNRAYNLTAVRDPREMVPRHLLDSLAMEPFLDGIASLADLGTGPGLPGIPLAIARPALRVTLVEANGKKARFLREAVRTLGLANAEVVQSRIEALERPGAFDAITARALATLPQILEFGGHLLAPGGKLLAMKGARPDAEIAALPRGWRLQTLHRLTVPGLEGERHLVVVGRDATATA
jgi:16S rRNA (guanine527-N7)-methyltransferase